ncbi:RimK family alpha-L-glutamate ligase [Chitinimonas sp.]|uniref:ATP-grasp domain-containing protein n=1 Tax=Chitinimonas sp. TaxID=1934313 RepID=UPI0035AE9A6E
MPDQLMQRAQRARGELIGLANFAVAAFRGIDLAPLCQALISRVEADPDDANGLLDLAIVLQLSGQRELGLGVLRSALEKRRIYTLPAPRGGAIRLLLFMVAGDLAQNNAIEFLTMDSDITLLLCFVGQTVPAFDALPEHDVAMVAVCESSANRSVLTRLAAALAYWPRPLINRAERILASARDATSQALDGIAGLQVPPTRRLRRASLQLVADGLLDMAQASDGLSLPLIARPLDSQKGQGLCRLGHCADVQALLANPGIEHFFVAPFVDYRSPDGLYRKWRIMLLGGQPYLCHLAISQNWIVHYLSAGMSATDSAGAAKRAEEARAMQTFESDFLPRYGAALKQMAWRLGLEYVGVDCGFDQDGRLLLFEADAGMTIHLMDGPELFPYKHQQMPKVFAAFRQLLVDTVSGKDAWQL